MMRGRDRRLVGKPLGRRGRVGVLRGLVEEKLCQTGRLLLPVLVIQPITDHVSKYVEVG